MALTNNQLITLKAAIAAETDPTFVAFRDAGATGAMTSWYNEAGSFIVWKTFLSEQEITSLTSDESTVWNWTTYIATTVSEKMAWERIFNGTFSINPALAQVRDGIADIFSGPQGDEQRVHLLAMAKRPSLRGEELFATGTGTVLLPGDLVVIGNLSHNDVVQAIHL